MSDLTHTSNNVKQISEDSEFKTSFIIGQKYSWGEHGWICFEANNLLLTKWVEGSYEWVDSHSLHAIWAGFRHFLRFNSNYSTFMSTRLEDHNSVRGYAITHTKLSPIDIFTSVYEDMVWGSNNHTDYIGSSGDGSYLEKNVEYISFVKTFIKDKEIKTVVDLGCGDWKCGLALYDELKIQYTGYDAYEKIINFNKKTNSSSKYTFIHMDFLNNPELINSADICIIKDVLQHWPLESIYTFLDYICLSKKFKYILITNCSYQKNDNTQIQMGDFRPLSKDFLPLKKYSPIHLLSYLTKEVVLIPAQQ